MGGHAERVSALHRHTLALLGYPEERINQAIPENKPISTIARALYLAWYVTKLHSRKVTARIFRKDYGVPTALVLVVVEDVNQNQIDQRHIEYALSDLGIPASLIARRSLTQCADQ